MSREVLGSMNRRSLLQGQTRRGKRLKRNAWIGKRRTESKWSIGSHVLKASRKRKTKIYV